MFSKHRRAHTLKPEINLTPMIDLMSELMVVFMVTAPLLTTGMTVDLPKGGRAAIEGAEKSVDIAVDKAGNVYIGKEKVAGDKLKSKLAVMLKQNPQLAIVISGDAGSRYGKVIEVMGDLKSAGFKKVGLKTEPEAARPNK
jgi:biopolymer transport protein TolR